MLFQDNWNVQMCFFKYVSFVSARQRGDMAKCNCLEPGHLVPQINSAIQQKYVYNNKYLVKMVCN